MHLRQNDIFDRLPSVSEHVSDPSTSADANPEVDINVTNQGEITPEAVPVLKREKDKDGNEIAEGIVIEALPNAMFRVILKDSNEELIAYLAGKMRRFRIRVLVGDAVRVKLDPYGGKARLVTRL